MNEQSGGDNAISSAGFRSIVRGVVLLSLVLLLGTAGYMVIEGWPLLESFYMTVITITTVGYGEVGTVSEPGRGLYGFPHICRHGDYGLHPWDRRADHG